MIMVSFLVGLQLITVTGVSVGRCSREAGLHDWCPGIRLGYHYVFLRQVRSLFQREFFRKYDLEFFFYWRYNPLWVCILQPSSGAIASSRTTFLDHTQRHATVGRTPLDEWSVRRRDLYLTTHNTLNRQTSMPRVGFEPTITAGDRP